MPSEQQTRAGRREAVRIFSRIGNVLQTPERLNRDAPKDAVERFLDRLVPAVESPEEMAELRRGIALWNSGGGQALYLQEDVPEDVQNAPQAEAAMPRVHCADIQLTFNADFLAGQSAPWHIIRFDKLVFCSHSHERNGRCWIDLR